MPKSMPHQDLPLRRTHTPAWVLSIVVAILIGVLSLAGLIFSEDVYPAEDLMRSFMTNDAINLVLGLPILLIPMWLTQRGSLTALLCWPGALLYNLYNYTAYIFGIPPSLLTFAYILIVLLCAYGAYALIATIDSQTIKIKMDGVVPRKTGSGLLILFGIAFLLRSIGLLVQVGLGQEVLAITDIGVLIADLVLSTVALAGGILLLLKRPLGFASSLGLLFAVTMLFVGLLLIFLIQPILTAAPFSQEDFFVVGLMLVIWMIPCGFYWRGAVKATHSRRTSP